MKEKNSLHTSPQLDHNEQHALALSPKQINSIYEKAQTSGISIDILLEVYARGFNVATINKTQAGFDRVNSFIHGGQAYRLDSDLAEGAKHLAKQVGSDILSTAFPHIAKAVSRYKKKSKYRKAMNEAVVQEPISTDPAEPASRFAGTDQSVKVYRSDTPGQGPTRADTIKRVVMDKINKDKSVKEDYDDDSNAELTQTEKKKHAEYHDRYFGKHKGKQGLSDKEMHEFRALHQRKKATTE